MEEKVILIRLSGEHGFFNMTDVLELAGQLQESGFAVDAEQAPAALMDSPQGYFLKVPVEQREAAAEKLSEILKK